MQIEKNIQGYKNLIYTILNSGFIDLKNHSQKEKFQNAIIFFEEKKYIFWANVLGFPIAPIQKKYESLKKDPQFAKQIEKAIIRYKKQEVSYDLLRQSFTLFKEGAKMIYTIDDIPKKLKILRKYRNLTQLKCDRLLGCKTRAWYDWENKREIELKTIALVATTMKIDITYFFIAKANIEEYDLLKGE